MARSSEKEMTILEHIAELRDTIIWAAALAAGAALVAWFFSARIVDSLLRPAVQAGHHSLYFTSPLGALMLRLKAAGFVGLLAVAPLILFKIYGFVLPGLRQRERRVITPVLVVGTALFYTGVVFCFLVLMPVLMRVGLSFASESLQPWLSAGEYLGLAARMCLAMGAMFELPLVVFALATIGIVSPRMLMRRWREAVVIIMIAAAVLTPGPDVASQIMLGVPILLLYFLSVFAALLVTWRRKRKQARQLAESN
jgi:sec-independent protein translocase protein TatC